MKASFNYSLLFTALAIAFLPATRAHAQAGAVVGGVVSQATIGGIEGKLDAIIDKARDTGDYLLLNAAIQAKNAIEGFETAAGTLVDKANSDFLASQKQVFDNAQQVLDQAQGDAQKDLKAAQQVTDQVNNLVVNLPFGSKETFVTRYSPHIKPAQETDAVTLVVNGVNLDKGDPQLALNSVNANRNLIGPLEVQFIVPIASLNGDPDKLAVVPLTLSYSVAKNGFWNRLGHQQQSVQRQLPIVTLPTNIGHYIYSVTTTVQQRQVQQFTSQEQRFSGKNTTQPNFAVPPGGWKWDWSQGLGAFRQTQYDGQAGTCNGIDGNSSSDNGIRHTAHLDQVKSIQKIGDGWVNCSISGPIYRMVPVTTTSVQSTGALTWTSDLNLQVPDGTTAIDFEIVTFDGRKRIMSGTDHDKFFDVFLGPTLQVKPKQPDDL
jgi:vacuolar-type H+-ATPase subunit H